MESHSVRKKKKKNDCNFPFIHAKPLKAIKKKYEWINSLAILHAILISSTNKMLKTAFAKNGSRQGS